MSSEDIEIDVEAEGLKVDMDVDQVMEPMSISSSITKSHREDCDNWHSFLEKLPMGRRSRHLPAKYQLVTDENARKYSIWTLQFSVLVAAINTKMLNPNFPIMATPDAHPDSFPDTEPFDFNSATYFIPLSTLIGVAISSVFIGQISDRIGRKRVLWILSFVSAFGSIAKFYSRNTFWGFCIANFVFGFFLGNLPVAMAYVGDIFPTKKEKEEQLGVIVGCFVIGNSGGGMIAILMENSGLFSPLWVGAGLMFISTMIISRFLIEPGDPRLIIKSEADGIFKEDDDEIKRPDQINKTVMWNVVGGALLDNIGSTGLFPLCLSPLALEQYLIDFVDKGEEPIMTFTGYKWLSVCVALMVVPSTLLTPSVFRKIGVAGTCVLGNLLTACLTIALLLIGNGPATRGAFAGFVTVMYGGFPFTVFSQLTTGPMLDVLAPEDKIGYVQGLNNSAMNFGMALAPWALGLLADSTSTNTAIWTGVGISVGAALVNAPLMLRPEMGRVIEKPPAAKRRLEFDDEELADLLLKGEFVPPDQQFELNLKRAAHNKPFIVPGVKPYEEEKEELDELRKHAKETFDFHRDVRDQILSEIAEKNSTKEVEEFCSMLNTYQKAKPEVAEEATRELGQWIGEYLADNGYSPHTQSLVLKQMILSAFPAISRDKEFTPDNIEEFLVKSRQVVNRHLEPSTPGPKKYALRNILGSGASQVQYQ